MNPGLLTCRVWPWTMVKQKSGGKASDRPICPTCGGAGQWQVQKVGMWVDQKEADRRY